MDISIERATAEDAEALVRVEIAAFHYDAEIYPGVEIGGPPGYDSVDVMLKNIQEAECYKITDGGRCIGGIVLFEMGEGRYHLDLLFIDSPYHNRGIGTEAMRFIEQAYPAAQRWTLDTPVYATRNHHFYEKLGYMKVGEHHDGDVPLIAYEKQVVSL